MNGVLKELGALVLPTLTVWNKADACVDPGAVAAVAAQREATVCVSARTGTLLSFAWLHMLLLKVIQ